MNKWADYLISEVSYDSDHLILLALRHKETKDGITKGKPVDRLTISSDIKNGSVYITIYNLTKSWKRGEKIKTFSIDGTPYLRIDENKDKLDFLGDLPPLQIIKPESFQKSEFLSDNEFSIEQLSQIADLEKQIKKLEDTLPSQTPQKIIFNENEFSIEQLSLISDLKKQIQELESTPEPSSHRGSLPKESSEELSQELESTPESEPEQLSQVNDLEKQIDELEDVLFTQLNTSSQDPPISEQLTRIKESENEIEKLESIDIEHEIIDTLAKQNKKLDDIEKNLHIPLETKKIESLNSMEAYCVKCKTKREIKDPEETIMKNGRNAVKGFCIVCNCKIFRIGKIKK